ncbi:hypothetical protein PENTCL1PPCAC_14357, partial [Pristionchus entomophagus]
GVLTVLVAAFAIKFAQYYYSLLAGLNLLWRWARTGGDALRLKEREMPRLIDNYTHNYILLPSGVNMHFVDAGDPNAPLMVMVHGYPGFWYSWRFQIEHFKDRYRVIAIDQRGYGDSSKPPNIADYSIPVLAKDLDDLIHGLGFDNAIVLGHDWGGIVAWRHALLYPQSVQRLIICNCPHPAAFTSLLAENGIQQCKSWYVLFFQTLYIPEATVAAEDFKVFETLYWGDYGLTNKDNFTVEDMEAWKCTFSKPDCLRSAINYYRCLYQMPDKGNIRQKCAVKTLILWGDNDAFLVNEGAILSKDWCDDATLQIIPGASHWVQQDEPNIVNGHIDNFLLSTE